MIFGGLEVFETIHCADVKQTRFPKSKKKRIRRKWQKDPRNYEPVPWDHACRIGFMLICHPAFTPKLRQILEGENERTCSFLGSFSPVAAPGRVLGGNPTAEPRDDRTL